MEGKRGRRRKQRRKGRDGRKREAGRKRVVRRGRISEYTRMWANAQRDGRPAEYRWRPLFNAAKFG